MGRAISELKKTALYQSINRWRWRERLIHPGKANSDDTYFVIRRHAEKAGLFSFVMTSMGSCLEAEERGLIPVVDMQNAKNLLLNESEVGKVNAWDYFFEQPGGVPLETAMQSRNVVLSGIDVPRMFPGYSMFQKPEEMELWRNVAHKYLKLQEDIQEEVMQYYKKALWNQRVLGVLCRGTDYLQLKPRNHPVQPDPDNVIRQCSEVMERKNCDSIYLATEDETIWQKFQKAFPGRVYCYQTHRYHIKSGEYINDVIYRKGDSYRRNREYLISIAILSMCDCLVAGITGGTLGAMLLTRGYEYEYIYDLGLYP